MYEMFAYILEQAWKHKRNRFIAVGGSAVFFFALTMLLVQRFPEAPGWLLNVAAFLTGATVLATIALLFYYIVKFIVLGVTWVLRELHVLPKRKQENDQVSAAGTILR